MRAEQIELTTPTRAGVRAECYTRCHFLSRTFATTPLKFPPCHTRCRLTGYIAFSPQTHGNFQRLTHRHHTLCTAGPFRCHSTVPACPRWSLRVTTFLPSATCGRPCRALAIPNGQWESSPPNKIGSPESGRRSQRRRGRVVGSRNLAWPMAERRESLPVAAPPSCRNNAARPLFGLCCRPLWRPLLVRYGG